MIGGNFPQRTPPGGGPLFQGGGGEAFWGKRGIFRVGIFKPSNAYRKGPKINPSLSLPFPPPPR